MGKTTQHLVEDIEKLRKHLNLDKILLFGGSWGSKLGLAYGETYPEHVNGMVLRGIFTGTQEEIDHFYHGGVRAFFPETYEKLENYVEVSKRNTIPKALFERTQSGDRETIDQTCLIWAKYEYKLGMLHTPDGLFEIYS